MGVVGVCVLTLVALPVQAELVTINIEGVVDTVEDDGYYLDGQIHIGDIITGWYTYDTDTPDTNPSDNVGDYEHSTSPYGVHLTVGGFTFMTDPTNVDFLLELVNDYPSGDSYLFHSYNNLDLGNGASVDMITWDLDDSTGGTLYSDDLSQTAPNLASWDGNELRIHGERVGYLIDGHVTSAVPEPATILTLFVGACMALRKRS